MGTISVKVDADCAFAEPITINENVEGLLLSLPDSNDLDAFLNDIANHNELYDQFC